jgi:hypothetical protein
MKLILAVCIVAMYSLAICLNGKSDVAAQPSTNLKILIFPLECSVDLTNVGVGVYKNLTPENCMDPIEEPVVPVPVPVPEAAQSPSEPIAGPASTRTQYSSFYSSLDHIFLPTDMSNRALPTAPLIARADDTRIIKSLARASSSPWVVTIAIGLPLLVIVYTVGRYVLILFRRS